MTKNWLNKVFHLILLFHSGSTSFSICSGDDFERLVLRGDGVCLRNPPLLSDVVNVAKCGNGILEEGEQCDCSSPEVQLTTEQ